MYVIDSNGQFTKGADSPKFLKRIHHENPNLFLCNRCGYYYESDYFSQRNGKPVSRCKKCVSELTIAYKNANPNKFNEWVANNKEYRNKYAQLQYKKHRAKRLNASAEYHKKNPEIHAKASRKYIAKNRDKLNKINLIRAKKKYKANPEKFREKQHKNYWENPEKYRSYGRQHSKNVDDIYVKTLIINAARRNKNMGVINSYEIPPKIVELKKEQIKMKRTLKQFKKWRQENESSNANVSRKQPQDEINNEGRFSTGKDISGATRI